MERRRLVRMRQQRVPMRQRLVRMRRQQVLERRRLAQLLELLLFCRKQPVQ
jgi:hypothetical protein